MTSHEQLYYITQIHRNITPRMSAHGPDRVDSQPGVTGGSRLPGKEHEG